MTFEPLTVTAPQKTDETGIKASLVAMRGSEAKLRLIIASATAKNFGWSAGDGIQVQIGKGEHHGMLRLRKNNSVACAKLAGRTVGRSAEMFWLALGHQPTFVNRAEKSSPCHWEKLADNWIEITLPAWARETGLKPQQARPHPAPSGPREKRNVTAELMGDPPPGRSALPAK